MSTQTISTEPTIDPEVEAARVGATFRLMMAREQSPELGRAEALARLDLVAAIMAMGAAEGIPGRHNLQEQAAVETSRANYAQALANLVRGDAPE